MTGAGDLAARLRADIAAEHPEWLHRLSEIVQPDGSLRFVVKWPRWGLGPNMLTHDADELKRNIDSIANKYQARVVAVDQWGRTLYTKNYVTS